MGGPKGADMKPPGGVLLFLWRLPQSLQPKIRVTNKIIKEGIIMLSKRNITMCGIVVFAFIFLATLVPINAADTTEQVINQIDKILEENPLKPGEKAQTIKIAEDDTISLLVLRVTEGVWIKPHIHKTHNETVYVIKGTAQMLIKDKWVDLKPGSLHFNPMGKVHSFKNTGNEPAVIISIFTPAMKEPDRHFVQ
jgi:mannose-6-phosphate isomerase-like protein (cupin superfamily)